MYLQQYIPYNTKIPKYHRVHHTPGHKPFMEKKMLPEKAPAEEFYEDNQKRINNIFGKSLYYDRAINPKMLMALNTLAEVKKRN